MALITETNVGPENNSFTYVYPAASIESMIRAMLPTDSSYNVTLIVRECTLQIQPIDVKVTADDAEKLYGTADPEFTATVEVTSEGYTGPFSESDISYTLIRPDKEAEGGEDVGEHTIHAIGNLLQGNFRVTFVDGTLTIKNSTLEIEAVNYNRPYDAESHSGGVEGTLP
jgi:hypothetical protein